MSTLKCLLFLIVLCVSIHLSAQDKFEKESLIKPKDVPSKALLFINSLNLNSKVKWYEEEGLDKQSVEVKFKQNKTNYSVEFNTLGIIEDIEIEVPWKDLSVELKNALALQLKQDCLSFKIVKVQRQFTGNENDLFLLLENKYIFERLKTKYEMVIRCKQQGSVNLFEYLFNDKGNLISISKIVFKNSSHLEY